MRLASLTGLVMALVAGSLRAETVEVTFEGEVSVGLGAISAGDRISGRIVYDDSVAGSPGAGGGDSKLWDAITLYELSLGDFRYRMSGSVGRVRTENDHSYGDGIGFLTAASGLDGPGILGLSPSGASLYLLTSDHGFSPTSDLADHPTSYELATFDYGRSFAVIFEGGGSTGIVFGRLIQLAARPVADSDGDAIPDAADSCPYSDLGPTVVIDECDSGVANSLLENGCSVSDLISLARETTPDGGRFVIRVLRLALRLVREDVLERREAARLVICAARSGPPGACGS